MRVSPERERCAGWASRSRSTILFARRFEWDASRRALELICRMFMVRSLWDLRSRPKCICCSEGPEGSKMDLIVPHVKQ